MRQTARFTAAVMVVALVGAPAQSFAKRLDSDQISGRPLSSCDPSHTVAPDISAFSGELSASNGVLWSRRATSQHAMASTTKLMTCLIALERCDLDETVTISSRASSVPYALGLQTGERMTVRQLLELALIASSNDAAMALAEHVGGSIPGFADIMNERAAQLGMKATHYVNPHGLDAPGHYTSAQDLATLAKTVMKLPEFRRIIRLRSVTVPAYKEQPARTVKSTNALLRSYRGIIGGKTGFTDDAKYALVSFAERDGITLTAVILGAPSSETRFKTAARLLDWGFKHLRVQAVASPTQTVGTVPVSANPGWSVPARFSQVTTLPVFDLDGPVSSEASLASAVSIPVFEGEPLGTVRLMQGDRTLATATAVAAIDLASAEETVGAVPISDYIDRTVVARASESSAAVQEFDPAVPVERTITLDPQVNAPVAVGAPLGKIVYTQEDRIICTVPAVAATRVEAPGTLARFGIWIARGLRGLVGAPRIAAPQVAGS
ncbi:MAG: hypothetical protein CVT67_04040 [Actinobacteria bacterium HGW-Actinobacteria-7]|nr:MAG: hypothetical protein CVT67_04040 [Actinobacteria bacterium HGW-Actinobacteria-7]